MQAKNNRVNTDFQILYFLIGSCHTPDGAYALLLDLRDERQMALNHEESQKYIREAEDIRSTKKLDSEDEAERLEGKAALIARQLSKELDLRNVAAARAELDFINKCIEKIQPFRKYSNLPNIEAHQAAQQEEWLQELIFRAQNYLMTTGSIHVDHFSTMRMHPEFTSRILPAITETKQHIENGTIEKLFTPKEGSPNYLLQSFIDSSSNLIESSESKKPLIEQK